MVNSPKITYAADGKPHERTACGTYATRGLIATLVLIALAIIAAPWFTSDLFSRVTRTNGTVRGIVVNAQQQALGGAIVFVIAAPNTLVTTASDGSFEINNIPAGMQSVVVVYNEIGQEYPVNILSSTATELGALAYTAPPDK
jgi:hypothetical protein